MPPPSAPEGHAPEGVRSGVEEGEAADSPAGDERGVSWASGGACVRAGLKPGGGVVTAQDQSTLLKREEGEGGRGRLLAGWQGEEERRDGEGNGKGGRARGRVDEGESMESEKSSCKWGRKSGRLREEQVIRSREGHSQHEPFMMPEWRHRTRGEPNVIDKASRSDSMVDHAVVWKQNASWPAHSETHDKHQ